MLEERRFAIRRMLLVMRQVTQEILIAKAVGIYYPAVQMKICLGMTMAIHSLYGQKMDQRVMLNSFAPMITVMF